jgi:hypothetical protein
MLEAHETKPAVSQGIGSFIRDRDGKVSSSRLLLITWGVGTFVIWAISSYQTKVLQALPDSIVTVIGILAGSKAIQRFGENT